MIYLGVWRVAKLTIPPAIPPTVPPTILPTIPPTIIPRILPPSPPRHRFSKAQFSGGGNPSF